MKAKESRQVKTVTIAVIGGLIVMAALVLGTIWMGRSAGRDVGEAVRAVSLLYLDELAGRREQVVEENLQDRIGDMETALDLMTEEDLQDAEHRQAYQKKMRALFDLEKFALVDEDGLIYTADGMQDDIDNYLADYHSVTGPEIIVKNLNDQDKKVIIAMPVDLMSEG